ncbi:MAG: hypothetical protein Q9169_007622 [Polycauliona sp. 2 TL-2023]
MRRIFSLSDQAAYEGTCHSCDPDRLGATIESTDHSTATSSEIQTSLPLVASQSGRRTVEKQHERRSGRIANSARLLAGSTDSTCAELFEWNMQAMRLFSRLSFATLHPTGKRLHGLDRDRQVTINTSVSLTSFSGLSFQYKETFVLGLQYQLLLFGLNFINQASPLPFIASIYNRLCTMYLWHTILALASLSHRGLILAQNATSTSLTQVGITADCNKFTYANPDDTCDETAQLFGITRAQLAIWNPVLGLDGTYCETQFWAGYDYCVGVSGTASAASIPPLGIPDAAIFPGKTWTVLPNDGSPTTDYTVNGHNCTAIESEFYSDCWKKLNMDAWLAQWHQEEPQCVSGLPERGCNIISPGVEAWTTTLLREYAGTGGSNCVSLTEEKCDYAANPGLGAGIPALARARYRYAYYNIIGTLICLPLLI